MSDMPMGFLSEWPIESIRNIALVGNDLNPAAQMPRAETELRRREGWELHTDWAFHDPSFGGTFREDCRDTVCSECGKVW